MTKGFMLLKFPTYKYNFFCLLLNFLAPDESIHQYLVLDNSFRSPHSKKFHL